MDYSSLYTLFWLFPLHTHTSTVIPARQASRAAALGQLHVQQSEDSFCLVGDTDHTTGRSRARITRLLRLLVPALAEIVGALVNDDGSLQHRSASIHFSCPVPTQFRDMVILTHP